MIIQWHYFSIAFHHAWKAEKANQKNSGMFTKYHFIHINTGHFIGYFIGFYCNLESLNFSFFLREKVEDGHGLQLDLTYRRTIRNCSQDLTHNLWVIKNIETQIANLTRITTNPGRDAGVLKKRPRSDDYLGRLRFRLSHA